MGEAINLVNNFKVEKVFFNCGPYNDLEKELIKVLDKKKIPYYSCIKELNIDNNKLYFLQTKEYDNENDNSNVIYTEIKDYKFMFMGDTSITTEKEYNELTEDEKRLYRRNQARKGNYNLNQTAVKSGVKDLARFHNAGYKGLYNGETADDIFKRKKLRYREDILDNMGSEELADNIFRIAQTDAKLKRDNVDNEYTANSVHYEVGKEVRNSIKRLGGTMPEDLPTPDKSLKKLEKENKKVEKKTLIKMV